MKNKFLKNCLALFLITLVAGVSLAFVNEITKEPIAKAQDKARLEAYEVVYPDAQFEALDNTDEILKTSSASLKKENLSQCTVDDVLKATDKNGNLIGYVFSATSPSGYGGDVKVAIGVSAKTNSLQALLFCHTVKLQALVLRQQRTILNHNLSANLQTVLIILKTALQAIMKSMHSAVQQLHQTLFAKR